MNVVANALKLSVGKTAKTKSNAMVVKMGCLVRMVVCQKEIQVNAFVIVKMAGEGNIVS